MTKVERKDDVARGAIPDWLRRLIDPGQLVSMAWVDHYGTLDCEGRKLFVSEPYQLDADGLMPFLDLTGCRAFVTAPGSWFPGTLRIQVSPPPYEDDARYLSQPRIPADWPPDHVIYGLKDPRDGLFRYVGMTADFKRRMEAHRRGDWSNQEKARWVRELQDAKLDFVPTELERTIWEKAREREKAWIIKLRHEGHPLFSGEYGRQVRAAPEEWANLAVGLKAMRRMSMDIAAMSFKVVGASHPGAKMLEKLWHTIDKARCRLDSTLYRLTGRDDLFYGGD